PVVAVREITGGRGVDHVFEVVGRPELMAAGIDMLARGGTLTLVGAAGRDEVLSMKPRSFMSKQQRVQGCIYGNVTPERDLPMFADLVYRRSPSARPYRYPYRSINGSRTTI
ncbi:MAG TPA: zinc-binding dehydrogenase, partial [Acidimicrobiales bacterium]|nr:zinc-binding dehydrogenase [Acidimicrobiales bacterium]